MDGGDWRSQLQQESRQRVINKIMDTLQRQLPIAGPESMEELRKIALRFEDKTFFTATDKADYLKKISVKMLAMESMSQNAGITNQMPSNPANQNPPETGSHVLQSQVQNTGQSLPFPSSNQSQARQQSLAQGLQNNIASAAVQGSASVASAMPYMNGSSQSNLSSINVNNVEQTAPQNIYTNSQRQIQGRPQQHPIIYQQQSLNPHLHPQQLKQQQETLKTKLPHPSLLQSQVQQQQQQPLLSATQMQSSQRALMQMSSTPQSSQSSLQQNQPPAMQSVLHSEHQQNQPNMLQQLPSPLLQQHPQVALRQQQPLQTSTVHQQTSSRQQQVAPISQQPVLPHHQQLPGHRSNITNMQQNQILGQQNGIPDIHHQQYRLAGQQNNLMNMQIPSQMNVSSHQQVALQSSMSGLHQFESQQMQQQSHLLGSQPNISNMQQYQQAMHIMQPQKSSAQQQSQQASPALMQSQGEQPQANTGKQQLMPQIQNQTGKLEQKMLTQQQQPNHLQREMQPIQQRLQVSGSSLHALNAIEQHKPAHQSQRGLLEASPNSMDSTSQMGHLVPDWQEEMYQKIQSMKNLYYADLAELHQKVALRCQQHDALMPPGKHSEQLDNIKKIKTFLHRMLSIMQMPKSSIQPLMQDRLPFYEKQIVSIISSNRRKNSLQLQGQSQFSHPAGATQSMPQPTPSQFPPIQQHGIHGDQMSSPGIQGSVTSMQSTVVSSMGNGSMPLPTHVGVSAAQQNIMSPLQSCSNVDSSQVGAPNSLQQEVMQQGAMALLHQTISSSSQTNVNTLTQTNNALPPNLNPLQPNANALQQHHLKQEHEQKQLMHPQQTKQQIQQHQMQQQKQQVSQQQPLFHQQHKQQQSAQLLAHQTTQLHQMNDMNDLKARQDSATKPGSIQSHFPVGQHQTHPHHQLKSGTSLLISSPQNLQVPSPQISQNSSQVDQGLLSSLSKATTPLQTNSPFVTSPPTPIAPSPLPGDHDKQASGISSLSNAGNTGHQLTSIASNEAQSLAVGTPGISASPLLAEYTGSDASQGNAQSVLCDKSTVTERPIERLVKAVQSSSPKVLVSSVRDIDSVVSMVDMMAGSLPGNGSRAAVGEDLAAMTKCHLQARNFMLQDGSGAITNKMKRHTMAMPLSDLLLNGGVNENEQLGYDLAASESTVTASQAKRQKFEAEYSLLEEIREINLRLIDTMVCISDKDADLIAAAAEGGEGIVVTCSYRAVALCPNLKSQLTSAQLSPISPLRLLIPLSYPNSSPVLLDEMPVELSTESEDLSVKAKSMFSRFLRDLRQPMSLGEMVRTWDICARKAVEEYTLRYGGGSFSTRYGRWGNCVTA